MRLAPSLFKGHYMQNKRNAAEKLSPAQVLLLGFAALIAIGAVLLSLPLASADRRQISFFEAVFTATSAACVTGLAVVDTALDFSAFGHAVIFLLIQVGGLGFMLFTTLIMHVLRKRISLHSRILMRETVGAETLGDVTHAMLRIGLIALLVEGMGAVLLAVRFVPEYGWGKGVWYAAFHAVSAYCNAGFDLFGRYESLARYQNAYDVQMVISLLIILGGFGYAVMEDVWLKRCSGRRLSLHTKIVLSTTFVLLLAGVALFFMLSPQNENGIAQKLMHAFFQSVTTRTAGFSLIDQMQLTDGSKLVSILLMFIGASPASTGGGAKTTTLALLLLVALATVKGQQDIRAFKRTLPVALVRTAICIVLANALLLMLGTLVLTVTEADKGINVIDLMYETVSALSTVGLSSVGTPCFSLGGKLLLMLYMYIGRVGPMTVMLVLAGRNRKENTSVRYPEESLLIG